MNQTRTHAMPPAMIVLTVKTSNGSPTGSLSASFDELGGTIGRAETNHLVLPDPDRSISRVHARVVFRNGSYAIVDHGSNPVMLNGIAIGNGREAPIRDGDQLQIGGYVIAVVHAHKTTAVDPFADLFGPGAATSPAPSSAAPRATLARPTSAAQAPSSSATPSAPGQRSTLPDDWNPFAPTHAPAATPTPSPGNALGFDLPVNVPPREDSLDALFALGGSGVGVGVGGGAGNGTGAAAGGSSSSNDPLAGSPLSGTAAPNTAADLDPFAALGRAAAPVAPPVPDHAPDLSAPWVSRSLRPSPAAPPTSNGDALPGAVLSWDRPSRERQVIRPTAPTAPAAPAGAASIDAQALARAFAEGLGSDALTPDRFDEEHMRLVGSLLREATKGAVDMLQARAAFKREMRSDVTMVVARDNNALKFSPSAPAALKQLLGPPLPGYMAPADSMKDAFDDLRAHQLGMVAGMRAALEGVLERFDPKTLESRLTKRSPLEGLLPSGRKARLWELFQELYSQLSSEASDDFQQLFGKAFRRAYEAHIDELQRPE